ncbi:MAG TPA: hypothetical protein VJ851_05225 [Jatrophihabitans sp.]|nr:hypothetical protein [Jatrophihabitans sp.]
MSQSRVRLPSWTSHPGFGVLVLLAMAVALIAHGEPQPSSRPSGTSVGVSGTASAVGALPPLLYLRAGHVELRQQGGVRTVALPAGAVPLAVVAGRGLDVVLAALEGRQHALAVDHRLVVHDLGLADAVLPTATGPAAVIVESAVVDPGELVQGQLASTSGSPGPSASSTSPSASRSGAGPPPLRDYLIQRYDQSGRAIGLPEALPSQTRLATDTAEGLVVWQPVSRVYDRGVPQESLSAAATLIRPDGTQRKLGPVHPLAANAENLLVWDVAVHRFGVMPLRYITSTATSTASPNSSRSESAPVSGESGSGSPSPQPTTVAGVRWFLPTKALQFVTGPATFRQDGSAFAVYAQVGSRRRLVVAELQSLDTVQVLALAQPPAKSSPAPTGTPTLVSPSDTASTSTDRSSSASVPALEPDGYPIAAPLAPLWWGAMVVGLGADGTVIGYKPGSTQSALLDLGLAGIQALAPAP